MPYAHTEYRTYDVKSNSFSKWKEGAWAPGCAGEIELAVVDLRELPGVEDAVPDEKSTLYFYSVMAAFEKRATSLFAEVKRWLFISGSESHRLQTMELTSYSLFWEFLSEIRVISYCHKKIMRHICKSKLRKKPGSAIKQGIQMMK